MQKFAWLPSKIRTTGGPIEILFNACTIYFILTKIFGKLQYFSVMNSASQLSSMISSSTTMFRTLKRGGCLKSTTNWAS
jgi:hypothetical protein